MTREQPRRPIRIGNASGAIGDGIDQLYRLAASDEVDAITADYLAEFNLAWKAIEMASDPSLGYEPNFLEQLAWNSAAVVPLLATRRIKIVHNGGALNPRALAEATAAYLASHGVTNLKIAWVSGDDLTAAVRAGELGSALPHLDTDGKEMGGEKEDVLAANAYTGMRGIRLALEYGADIVVCGRCCDASPTMALAAWWHGWAADPDTDPETTKTSAGPGAQQTLDALAGALVAGHLIECGTGTTGGNFCGFREIPAPHHAGFPIAEIAHDGGTVITKPAGTNGAVTRDTVTAQLLYEIQGPLYLNPDVVARLDGAQLDDLGDDRVRVSGIVGCPPPPTAKLAVQLRGGFQAEIAAFAVGLDIPEKFALMKSQVLGQLDPAEFSTISIELYGGAPTPDPRSQAACTAMIRLFVQTPDEAVVEKFKKAIFFNGMQGFCGLHLHMDWRTLAPRPFVRYFPSVVDQGRITLEAHFVGGDKEVLKVANKPPYPTEAFAGQESYEPRVVTELASFGPTVRRPLGDLVFARSGDKGSNASLGLWVRSPAAWPWLQSFLTSSRLVALLADDWRPSFRVERFEAPALWAVHFVVYGILEDGVSSSSRIDGLAKSVGEFVRARVVELPVGLVEEEDKRRAGRNWWEGGAKGEGGWGPRVV